MTKTRNRKSRRIKSASPTAVRHGGCDPSPSQFADTLNSQTGRATPANPRLVASADGKLERLLLCAPALMRATPADRAFYTKLTKRLLKAGIEVEMLTQKESPPGKKLKPWPGFTRLIEVCPEIVISDWVRDPFIVMVDSPDNVVWLAEPLAYDRMADALIADWYANETDSQSTQTPLDFEGGNILCGDNFVMIGTNSVATSLGYANQGILIPNPVETPAELIRRLYRQCLDSTRDWFEIGTLPMPAESSNPFSRDGDAWNETHYVGNLEGTCQPIFHLDMFITLAGRATAGGKYRVLVGDPALATRLMEGDDAKPPREALADAFDQIADLLTALDFEVTRNPMPYLYTDDTDEKHRTWYYATSNNALVERFDTPGSESAGRVWLPLYAGRFGSDFDDKLKTVDQRNKEIWEKWKFEVQEVKAGLKFVEASGSIHCQAKEICRQPVQGPPLGHAPGWPQYPPAPVAPIKK